MSIPNLAEPALASPWPKTDPVFDNGDWVAEEKYDGHRILLRKRSDSIAPFVAWSRLSKPRDLPPHLQDELIYLPDGVYDGELIVPGKRSFGVRELTEQHLLQYVIFDVLESLGRDLVEEKQPYEQRKQLLDVIFPHGAPTGKVRQAATWEINSKDDVDRHFAAVLEADGEGLILKRRDSIYQLGKRMKTWVKVKALRTAELTIIGFQEGKMGRTSIVILQDDAGIGTTVKWKDFDLLKQTEANPQAFIGKKLQIEFQERTADGAYRHPRWDHLVEGE